MAEEEITVSTTDAQAASDEAGNLSEIPLAERSETDLQGSRVVQLEQQVSELEQKLARESEQATDYMNRYQRIQADFANFKRRAQQEQEQQNLLLAAQVITLFLPALDSFERAFATLPPSLRGYSWIDGISLVLMEMQHALHAYGVQPIEVQLGQAFDPSRHESVGEVETSEYPEGHIAVILQSGYEVQGRTLRPTLVQVARSPAAAPAEPGGAAEIDAAASSTQGNQ
ncbi:MAG: nucleotide exchange factor GrpE [Ktedonobacterales bacterium]